jgi:LAS superfamily LD-carboxypeptidase LdcB
MKHLVITLAFVVILFSCNLGGEKISQTEFTEIVTDTVKKVETTNPPITKAFILGKFDYKSDTTFVKVNPPYASKELYLNEKVATAFIALYTKAKADGVELKIISGTRNFKEQKIIWERKWEKYKSLEPMERALKILEFSAMPGSSRHHWGTDIDINSLNNSYFHSGKGRKAYQWLKTHANTFGFYQVYTTKDHSRTGYNTEEWHWSYLPLASKYLDFYNALVSEKDIKGFSGYEQAQKVMIIKNYVNGISNRAKD